MRPTPLKNVAVLAVALVLAALGTYNIFLKATWTLMDDGVLWSQGPQGVFAARVAPGGPAFQAGLRVGDIALALDHEEVLTSQQIEEHLARRTSGARLVYELLRAEQRRPLEVTVKPLSQGNVSLFYYLSLVGFFSLLVGTIVMLRRPPDRAALHFYAICLLFFLMYSTSYTGKLNLADWTLLWTDTLAILFLPVVFLHFCLAFPERRLSHARAWVIPAAYMPALALAGAAVASQVLFVTTPRAHREVLWQITSVIDNWKPIYFAALFAVSFGILLGSYRRTR
ncbi:MAG TPA: PDZ domain-containing protein, partial [Vicinamibacteria bacterium]|nr:PDZ domain-containing protein [Vicinamibacteria bacterium]